MKKKLLVLLLVLALVFSTTVLLLAACDNNGQGDGDETGYTITFKNNGRTLFELKTTDGKITKGQVSDKEEEFYRTLHSRDADGYFFIGWYTTVDVDDDGNTIYSGEINYARQYNGDATYHAGYEFAPTSGEENGYTLIGVIGNEADWGIDGQGAGTAHPEWILEQDETEGWIYRIYNVHLLSSDNFKLKTYDMGWDEGAINFGYADVTSIELADTADVDLKGHELKDELFYGNNDGNIAVSRYVEYADIDVEFNYREKTFDITITAMNVLDELSAIEYILVGAFPEGEWDVVTNASSLIFKPTGEPGVYTISHVFTTDLKFRVKQNLANWETCLGYAHVNSITGEGSIVAPAKDDLFTLADDNNMICNYDCTLTITLDTNKGTLDILITQLADDDTILWETEGYVLVGNFSDADWAKPRPAGDKYLFTQSEENQNIGTWSGKLVANTQFKVATNIAAWNGRINIGWTDGLVAYDQNGQPIANLLQKVGDNIRIRTDCEVTITLNVKNKTIKIVVKEDVDVPPVTDEPDVRDWGICGSLNGWGNDIMLTSQENGHKTISGQVFAAGVEFKIRADRSWDDSVGWHAENVKFVAGSGIDSADGIFEEGSNGGGLSNIMVVTACTVDIDLYYVNDGNWVLTITITAIG